MEQTEKGKARAERKAARALADGQVMPSQHRAYKPRGRRIDGRTWQQQNALDRWARRQS